MKSTILALLFLAFVPLLANAQSSSGSTPAGGGGALRFCQSCDSGIQSPGCSEIAGAGGCICVLSGDTCDTWGRCYNGSCSGGEKEALAYLRERLDKDGPDIQIHVAGNCAGGIKAVKKLQAEYKAKGKTLNARLPDDKTTPTKR